HDRMLPLPGAGYLRGELPAESRSADGLHRHQRGPVLLMHQVAWRPRRRSPVITGGVDSLPSPGQCDRCWRVRGQFTSRARTNSHVARVGPTTRMVLRRAKLIAPLGLKPILRAVWHSNAHFMISK